MGYRILWGAAALTLCIACESAEPSVFDAGAASPDAGFEPGTPDSGLSPTPDAGFEPRDSGFRIQAGHLSPATGAAEGNGIRLRGGLTPTTRPTGQSSGHRLTGGLIPTRGPR